MGVATGTGKFEVCEAGNLVVSGRVYVPLSPIQVAPCSEEERGATQEPGQPLKLNGDDVYKELRLRGYDYGPTFQGIVSASGTGQDLGPVLRISSERFLCYEREKFWLLETM